VKLEGKHDRERCDNYHDRDIDCGESELWKSYQLINQTRAHRRIVSVDEENPVGKPADQCGFDGYELYQ
jgi:hypothetical protein